ncbi:fimbria/pilus periplasmic chaperone [Enterobacter asburiae]|uniref:fimbria/pilus periplasmic chaperone n=1 Tax=Enterobacter asburiae TaxID=61645 RepID=UPI0020766396|nr:fimbria/pilus periplasmic chaperone [Enterobacter asburiae]MCM7773448.1 fimbria/pilus periplasmic chaperone [Enterobacter asburiae]
MKYHVITKALLCFALFYSYKNYAAGVEADTSLLFIDVSKGEGVVNVHNTDAQPVMLLTRVEKMPEGQGKLITIIPPLVRIEAHKTQQVRFVLTGDRGSIVQRQLKVYFAGLPITSAGSGKVEVTERQPLRIVINPTGLTPVREPCKPLQGAGVGSYTANMKSQK